MEAGIYKHLVEIQRITRTQNQYKETILTPETIATVHAGIIPVSAKEQIKNQQQTEQISHKIFIRYQSALSDLNTDDRIKHGEKIYNLTSVINIGNSNKDFQCLATEAK